VTTDRALLERIWAAVAAIPRGRVDSYGGVARRAGLPRRARLVGRALRLAPPELGLPWHRVLNAAGRISFPAGSDAYAEQRRRLEAEGLRFVGERVEAGGDDPVGLDRALWGPPGGLP